MRLLFSLAWVEWPESAFVFLQLLPEFESHPQGLAILRARYSRVLRMRKRLQLFRPVVVPYMVPVVHMFITSQEPPEGALDD